MSRQGSASFTVVIGGLTAIVTGAIVLTFFVYPISDAFMNSALWSSETVHGARVTTYVGGFWAFWGAIIMIAILAYIWITTRQ